MHQRAGLVWKVFKMLNYHALHSNSSTKSYSSACQAFILYAPVLFIC